MKKFIFTFIFLLSFCQKEVSNFNYVNFFTLLSLQESYTFLNMPLYVDTSRKNPPNLLERAFRRAGLDYILDDPDLQNKMMFAYKESPNASWKLFEYNADYEDTNRNGRIDPEDKGAFFPASTIKTFHSVIALERAKEYGYAVDDSIIILDNRASPGTANAFHPDVAPGNYPASDPPRSYADYDGNNFIPISTRNGNLPVDCMWNDFTYPGNNDGILNTYNRKGSIAELLRYTQGISNNFSSSYLISIAGWENMHTRYHSLGFKYFRNNRHFGDSRAFTSRDNCDGGVLDRTQVVIDGKLTPFTYGHYALYWSPPYLAFPKGKERVVVRAVYPTRDYYSVDTYDTSDQNNFASAREFLELIRRIVEFDSLPASQKFNVRSEDMAFLRETMERTPRELGLKYSSGSDYYDEYCKYFMPGLDKRYGRKNYRMWNKCGTAMGAFSDFAYIIHKPTERRFVVWWNTYSSDMNRLNLNYDQLRASIYYEIENKLLDAVLDAIDSEEFLP